MLNRGKLGARTDTTFELNIWSGRFQRGKLALSVSFRAPNLHSSRVQSIIVAGGSSGSFRLLARLSFLGAELIFCIH